MLTFHFRTSKEAEFLLVSHENSELGGQKTTGEPLLSEVATNLLVYSVVM